MPADTSASLDAPLPDPFLLQHLKKGHLDGRYRVVRDVLVAMDDFKVYTTDLGVSVCFSNDEKTAIKQKETYFRMAGIAEFNLLIHNLRPRRLWNRASNAFARQSGKAADPATPMQRTTSPSITLYERQLGRCISQALIGHTEEAATSLLFLREQLCARIRNRARVVHLLINLILTLLVLTGAYLFVWSEYSPIFGFASVEELGLSMAMGAVGALFSTTVRLQSLEIDPTVTPSMHWIYGSQRVIVGVIGALVVYFGFKSGVLTGLFQPVRDVSVTETQGNFSPYWLSFVSVIAGFSERLVPNLLDSHADNAMPGSDPAVDNPPPDHP